MGKRWSESVPRDNTPEGQQRILVERTFSAVGAVVVQGALGLVDITEDRLSRTKIPGLSPPGGRTGRGAGLRRFLQWDPISLTGISTAYTPKQRVVTTFPPGDIPGIGRQASSFELENLRLVRYACQYGPAKSKFGSLEENSPAYQAWPPHEIFANLTRTHHKTDAFTAGGAKDPVLRIRHIDSVIMVDTNGEAWHYDGEDVGARDWWMTEEANSGQPPQYRVAEVQAMPVEERFGHCRTALLYAGIIAASLSMVEAPVPQEAAAVSQLLEEWEQFRPPDEPI